MMNSHTSYGCVSLELDTNGTRMHYWQAREPTVRLFFFGKSLLYHLCELL